MRYQPVISLVLGTNPTDHTIDDIITTKFNCIPYIDPYKPYPCLRGKPLICIAQLNMQQIFHLLLTKPSTPRILRHFSQWPSQGLIQIYTSSSRDNCIRVVYHPYVDPHNHDVAMEYQLRSTYADYFQKDPPFISPTLRVIDANYGKDYVNATMWYHPVYANGEDSECQHLGEYNHFYHTYLGGFPFHASEPTYFFDEKHDLMLFSHVDETGSWNVKTSRREMKKLDFRETMMI